MEQHVARLMKHLTQNMTISPLNPLSVRAYCHNTAQQLAYKTDNNSGDTLTTQPKPSQVQLPTLVIPLYLHAYCDNTAQPPIHQTFNQTYNSTTHTLHTFTVNGPEILKKYRQQRNIQPQPVIPLPLRAYSDNTAQPPIRQTFNHTYDLITQILCILTPDNQKALTAFCKERNIKLQLQTVQ